MSDEVFIQYIGDYRIHDSRVKEITHVKDDVKVFLISEDGEIIIASFSGVKSIISNKPEGMILYSITEMKEEFPFRRFVFVNDDDEGESSLEVVADDCIIQYKG
ncbi:MAG: hypothetical protein AB6733_09110 [Clostridiaceae bacterium]